MIIASQTAPFVLVFFRTETNLQKVIMELFGAATETTSTAIRWAVVYFLHYPQVCKYDVPFPATCSTVA